MIARLRRRHRRFGLLLLVAPLLGALSLWLAARQDREHRSSLPAPPAAAARGAER